MPHANIKVHGNPVWRDRANFIIRAIADDGAVEQLWVRQVATDRFELCCIPFFLYDLCLGDIVQIGPDHVVRGVVSSAGRYEFRVWFGNAPAGAKETIATELTRNACILEWSSEHLLAVSVESRSKARVISGYLQGHELAGHIAYETTRTRDI